ncbi:MAG: NADH-quinone oxidoreductase subunit NuoF [Mesoaciditoga sp.]|uniref:NADH-quinone oxidoreductase subunit NuoF n=1 Tax=Athalassotoga sp. TaxID=2022597 RepID=UPI000CCB7344|nr:MAG: NADH-quinone oxidoreductase subunit NuoF [Mesoaciditoga sp.]
MKSMTILFSTDSNSLLNGSRSYAQTMKDLVKEYNLSKMVDVVETGTFGFYGKGVLFQVFPEDIYYSVSSVDDLKEIFNEHVLKGRIVSKFLVEKEKIKPAKRTELKETRIVLRNAGIIDPENIEEYIARDGYKALYNVLRMKQMDVIEMIKASGLRGRGGAGFPTGLKWEMTFKAKDGKKYVLCNADEGEPGTFKDRLILEGDPHSVIEAMAIAGYSIGADTGYIYIRGEYYNSIKKVQKAINDAKEYGLLGNNIFGSDFSFDIAIRPGAGSYVVGDETALMESLEGKAGRPRLKPPYPTEHGLYGKPTLINNVETFANVPWIILNGPGAFRRYGTEKSKGTKVFSLVGNVVNRGIVELPMGCTLRELIYGFGGGVAKGRTLKMVQTGGTAGTFVKPDKLDLPIDYESIKDGISLGSGSILVIDDQNKAIDIAKKAVKFYMHESCGKCTPCREGTRDLYILLDRISKGIGKKEDIERIRTLSMEISDSSFCGLGQSINLPLVSLYDNFKDEFLELVKAKSKNTSNLI